MITGKLRNSAGISLDGRITHGRIDMERDVLKRTMLKLSQLRAVCFRNNRGLFFTLDLQRKVRAGLDVDGSSDLIGWHSVIITPEMVGKKVAVFMACEVKTDTGRLSETQAKFLENVRKAGGIGFVQKGDQEISLDVLKFDGVI